MLTTESSSASRIPSTTIPPPSPLMSWTHHKTPIDISPTIVNVGVIWFRLIRNASHYRLPDPQGTACTDYTPPLQPHFPAHVGRIVEGASILSCIGDGQSTRYSGITFLLRRGEYLQPPVNNTGYRQRSLFWRF